MLTMEAAMEVRILHKQGVPIREIAERLGVSRNTVRRYVRSDDAPRYSPRPPRQGKLDPYTDWIRERLRSAAPYTIAASVIYREICARGYVGGERLVRQFVASIRPEVPAPPQVVRFETAPGVQMQVDWGVFKFGEFAASGFVSTLGYSRLLWVRFVTDQQFDTLRTCHIGAFEYFGGVPREILYDNMKTVIQTRNAYGAGLHRFHPAFWDFAKTYGFTPRVCQPYRAQTKGKVERSIRYLRESFFVPYMTQRQDGGLSLGELNDAAVQWLNTVANPRLHRGIDDRPVRRWETEAAALQPLPALGMQRPAPAQPTPAAARNDRTPLHHPLSIYERHAQRVAA